MDKDECRKQVRYCFHHNLAIEVYQEVFRESYTTQQAFPVRKLNIITFIFQNIPKLAQVFESLGTCEFLDHKFLWNSE